MRLAKNIIIVSVILITCNACIKQVDVATRHEKPILVVEGSITTDSTPYSVKLSYSGPLTSGTDIPDPYLEKNAKVTITDDQGNMTSLVYKDQGIYETSDSNYFGKVGRSYNVIIELKDGRKYISAPEKINPPVSFTNVNVRFVPDFDLTHPAYFSVYLDVKDPKDEENYYRWTFYSWTLRQTKGEPCGGSCIMFEYCFQKITDKEARIFSDASINGNEIKDQLVGHSYIYTFGKHYFDISQLSLTREAYQFWERYKEQVTRTGNILDPLPSSVKGNVYNASDSNDFALGYFSASSVTHKRAIIVPFGITQYLLNISAISFIPEEYVGCFDYFPNTLSYPPPWTNQPQYPPPPGWEDAEKIKVYW